MSHKGNQTSSTPLHSVSVAGAVIRDDGRMLVIKRRDNGNREPPGGVLELDEAQNRMSEAYAVRLLDALAPGALYIRNHDGFRLCPSD